MDAFPFAIIGFDLDGTLVDTHHDLAAALNHTLALAGRRPVPVGEVRKLIGGGTAKLLERGLMLSGGAVGETEFARLGGALLDYYVDHIAVHSRPYPGAVPVLRSLAERGVKLAVATNKLEALATRLLTELGLAELFDAIIGGDTLGPGRSKPRPDMLAEMVARSGGGGAAYVGDSSFDTRAARSAGLPCVAVSFGFHDLPPGELGADAVIDHFDELEAALARL